MKTKPIRYYVDLFPGWHESGYCPWPTQMPGELIDGSVRYAFDLELPEIYHKVEAVIPTKLVEL